MTTDEIVELLTQVDDYLLDNEGLHIPDDVIEDLRPLVAAALEGCVALALQPSADEARETLLELVDVWSREEAYGGFAEPGLHHCRDDLTTVVRRLWPAS